jgi:hypothetical protein
MTALDDTFNVSDPNFYKGYIKDLRRSDTVCTDVPLFEQKGPLYVASQFHAFFKHAVE